MSNDARMTGIETDRVAEMICSGCSSVLDTSLAEPFSNVNCPACNAPLTVPARLGHFRLLSLIGAGGMGAIYKALDESLGRHVAIKVMLKTLGEDAGSVEMFSHEARMLAALNHQNIVQVYSFGQVKGQPYIVMELVPGERLADMIARGKPLGEDLVARISLDVAQGLSAAHEMGLIHSDIKPENILLDSKGTAKVVDFGLASFADKQVSVDGLFGTPYYISPEKVKRMRVDFRSDMYSLGGTIYHALTGKPPFDAKTPVEVVKARLGNKAPALHEARPDILPSFESVVARMLEEEPAKRHPTYASLIADLTRTAEECEKIRKKDSGPVALQAGRVVLTKKHSMLREAVKAETVTRKSKPAAPAQTLKMTLVVLAFVAALIGGAGGAFWILHTRQSRQQIQSIVTEVSRTHARVTGSLDHSAKKAQGYRSQALELSRLVTQDNIAAAAICQEAIDRADDALTRIKNIDQTIKQMSRIRDSVAASKTPVEADKYRSQYAALADQAAAASQAAADSVEKASASLQRAVKALQK